jgi:hypothetical protein
MINVLNKNECEMQYCNFTDIKHILKNYHYKGDSMGGGISICFAMLINDKLVGGSVLGKPRHENIYNTHIDIRRMACIDSAPKNSESWFLGQIIEYIKRNTTFNAVLSYSDLTQGHKGTIYKASNFVNIGETSPSQHIEYEGKSYHMRSLTIDRPYSFKIREAIKIGDAKIVTGLPKIIWEYKINRNGRKEKKLLKEYKNGGSQVKLF